MELGLDLGTGWEVSPAGGATGKAYIAKYDGQNRLFLKRNSSPFLAVLSAEGIVPKLIWTKRMENGDVITAQHWLNGRELKPVDMGNKAVAYLLSKIHHSKELLTMLQRIGKRPLQPIDLLNNSKRKVHSENIEDPMVANSIVFLENNIQHISFNHQVVCHCDVNHNNWLMSNEEELFLIDWDGAMITDPALDIGLLLYSYIPREHWGQWLNCYGVKLTSDLIRRMNWYTIYQTVLSVIWHHNRKEFDQYRQQIQNLEQLMK